MNSKEKKIGVSKVVIQMGDKEATLTVEQARELRDALNALLGEKVVERVIEKRDYWYPYTPPYKVYYGDTKTIPATWGTITVSGTDNAGNYTIGLTGGDLLPVDA